MHKIADTMMFLIVLFFIAILIMNYQEFIDVFAILLKPFAMLLDALDCR